MKTEARIRVSLKLAPSSPLFERLRHAQTGDIVSLLTLGMMTEKGAFNGVPQSVAQDVAVPKKPAVAAPAPSSTRAVAREIGE